MLPTIDVKGTTTVYSSFDEAKETPIEARVLSVSQSMGVHRVMQERAAEKDNDKAANATKLLWEMLIVSIPNAATKDGEFGRCVAAEWAFERLSLCVMSDVMDRAIEANTVTGQQRKNSNAQSGSQKQPEGSTAQNAGVEVSSSSEGASGTGS